MLEQKTGGAVRTVYFIALAAMMYYFLTQYVYLPPLYVPFRHLFALLITASAFVCFLIRPDLPRAVSAVKAGAVLSIPLLVMITVSLLIWSLERTDVHMITRGLSYYLIALNQASSAFAAVSFLYVFGERGIWYNLIAILCANLLMIATIMLENGVGPYLAELWTLIRTFAGENGPIIAQAEIHELAFCLGAYLVYMLTRPRRSVPFLVLLALSIFCFLSAFKRIALAAMAAAMSPSFPATPSDVSTARAPALLMRTLTPLAIDRLHLRRVPPCRGAVGGAVGLRVADDRIRGAAHLDAAPAQALGEGLGEAEREDGARAVRACGLLHIGGGAGSHEDVLHLLALPGLHLLHVLVVRHGRREHGDCLALEERGEVSEPHGQTTSPHGAWMAAPMVPTVEPWIPRARFSALVR